MKAPRCSAALVSVIAPRGATRCVGHIGSRCLVPSLALPCESARDDGGRDERADHVGIEQRLQQPALENASTNDLRCGTGAMSAFGHRAYGHCAQVRGISSTPQGMPTSTEDTTMMQVTERTARASAIADVSSWVIPFARATVLHLSAARRRASDPREVVALVAHQSSPFFALVRDVEDAAVREDFATALMPRSALDVSLEHLPADVFAVVVAVGADVQTQGVPLEALFDGGEVGRG